MTWSKNAWAAASPVYNQILEMPFIKALIDGSLSAEQFKFYIRQDAIYLESFSRALAQLAVRIPGSDDSLEFIRFAEGALVVEKSLHMDYFGKLGITDEMSIAPACHHYTNFLMSSTAHASVEVAMAAVLPCFWIYQQVGAFIYRQPKMEHNPYQDWIDAYAGEEFEEVVNKAIRLCDEAAISCSPKQQKQMTQAFLMSSKLEYMFWDSAWRLEKWAV